MMACIPKAYFLEQFKMHFIERAPQTILRNLLIGGCGFFAPLVCQLVIFYMALFSSITWQCGQSCSVRISYLCLAGVVCPLTIAQFDVPPSTMTRPLWKWRLVGKPLLATINLSGVATINEFLTVKSVLQHIWHIHITSTTCITTLFMTMTPNKWTTLFNESQWYGLTVCEQDASTKTVVSVTVDSVYISVVKWRLVANARLQRTYSTFGDPFELMSTANTCFHNIQCIDRHTMSWQRKRRLPFSTKKHQLLIAMIPLNHISVDLRLKCISLWAKESLTLSLVKCSSILMTQMMRSPRSEHWQYLRM